MEKENQKSARPPIVVVLGHVDHGKTTLLDAIRKTSEASKEAGGITQKIGASVVSTKDGRKITFLDTPGHAAFSDMRARGAKVADIALLVVAGDDGVQPQTKEALSYIVETGIHFIVVVTKIDLATSSLENVERQLEKEQVLFEGRGGSTPILGVSAKKGEGLGNLLEMITLISDVNEISGNSESPLDAYVIETTKDKRGLLVSVIVKDGSLKLSQEIATNSSTAKIRGMFDYLGNPTNNVGPGEPVQILGFSDLPKVGEKLWHFEKGSTPLAKASAKPVQRKLEKGQIGIILKVKNYGSLEAIKGSLPKEVVLIDSGVGDVNESDVFIAKSTSSAIYTFESKVPSSVAKLGEGENVEIKSFDIIYKLFEDLDKVLKEEKSEFVGRAQILKVFPFDNKKVAGCKVVDGILQKEGNAVLERNKERIGMVKIISMKKGKLDVKEVKKDDECGIIFIPQLEFKEGDMILSVRRQI